MTTESGLIRRVSKKKSSSRVTRSGIKSYPSVQNLDTLSEDMTSAPIHLYPDVKLVQPEAKPVIKQVKRGKDARIMMASPPEKRVSRDSWPPPKSSEEHNIQLDATSAAVGSTAKLEHDCKKELNKNFVEPKSAGQSEDDNVVAVVKSESSATSSRNSPLISYKSSGCKITISASRRGKEFSTKHYPKKSNLKVTTSKQWTGNDAPITEQAEGAASHRENDVSSRLTVELKPTACSSKSGGTTGVQDHKFAIPETFNFEKLQRCTSAVVSNIKEKEKKVTLTKSNKTNAGTSVRKASHDLKAKNLKRKFEHKFARASTFHSAFPRTSSPIQAVVENRLSLRNRKHVSTNALQSCKKVLAVDESTSKPNSSTMYRVKPVLRLKKEQSNLPFQVSNTDNGNWTVKYHNAENTDQTRGAPRPGSEVVTPPTGFQATAIVELPPPTEVLSTLPEVLFSDKASNVKKKSSRKSMESGMKVHDHKKKKSKHDEYTRVDKHRSNKHGKEARSSKHQRSHSAPSEKLSTLKRMHSIRVKDLVLKEKSSCRKKDLPKQEIKGGEMTMQYKKVLCENFDETLKTDTHANLVTNLEREISQQKETSRLKEIEDIPILPVTVIKGDRNDRLTSSDLEVDDIPCKIKVSKISLVKPRMRLDRVMKGSSSGDIHDDVLSTDMNVRPSEAGCAEEEAHKADGAGERLMSQQNMETAKQVPQGQGSSDLTYAGILNRDSDALVVRDTPQSSPKRKRTYSSTLSLASTGSQDEPMRSAFKRVRPNTSGQYDVSYSAPDHTDDDQTIGGQLLGEVVLMSSKCRHPAEYTDISKTSSVSDIFRSGLCTSHQTPASAANSEGEEMETNLKAVAGCIERLERDLAVEEQQNGPGSGASASSGPNFEHADIKVEPGEPLRVLGRVTYLSDLPRTDTVEVKDEDCVDGSMPLLQMTERDLYEARKCDSEQTVAYSNTSDVSLESLLSNDEPQEAREQRPTEPPDQCDVTSSNINDAHLLEDKDRANNLKAGATEPSQNEVFSPGRTDEFDVQNRLPSYTSVVRVPECSNQPDDDTGAVCASDDKAALQVNRPSSTTKCCLGDQACDTVNPEMCREFRPLMNPKYHMILDGKNELNCKRALSLNDCDSPIDSIVLRKVMDKMHSDIMQWQIAKKTSDKPQQDLPDCNSLSAEELHTLWKKELLNQDGYNTLYPQFLTVMPIHGTHDEPIEPHTKSPSPEDESLTDVKSPLFPTTDSHTPPTVQSGYRQYQQTSTVDHRESVKDVSQKFVSIAPATSRVFDTTASQIQAPCTSTVEISKRNKPSKSRKKRKSKGKLNDSSTDHSVTAGDSSTAQTSSSGLSPSSTVATCPPPAPALSYSTALIPRFPFGFYPAADPGLPLHQLSSCPPNAKEASVKLPNPSTILAATGVMPGQFPTTGNLRPQLGQNVVPPWAFIPRYAFNATTSQMSSAYMGQQPTALTSPPLNVRVRAPVVTTNSSSLPAQPQIPGPPDSETPSPQDKLVIDLNDKQNSPDISTASSCGSSGVVPGDTSKDDCKTTTPMGVLYRGIEQATTADNNSSHKSVGTAGTWYPPAVSISNIQPAPVRPALHQFRPLLTNNEAPLGPPAAVTKGQMASIPPTVTYAPTTGSKTLMTTSSSGSMHNRSASLTKRDSILYKAIIRQGKKSDSEDLITQYLRQGATAPAKPSEELKRLLVHNDSGDGSRARWQPSLNLAPNVSMTSTAVIGGPGTFQQPPRPPSSCSSEIDVVSVAQTEVSFNTDGGSNVPLDLRQPQRQIPADTSHISGGIISTQTYSAQSTIQEIQALLETLQKTIDDQMTQIQVLKDRDERSLGRIVHLEGLLWDERQRSEQLESRLREEQHKSEQLERH